MSHPFPATSIRNAVLLYGGMTILSALLALGFPMFRVSFGLPAVRLAWVWGLGAGAALVGMSWVAERVSPPFAALADALAAAVGPVSGTRAVVLAALSGVGEETLFRGPLQSWLGPVWPTLLFAGLHGLGQRRLWPWPLFALVAGSVFAGLTVASGSLWPAALAHAVVNAINLRRLGKRYRNPAPADTYA